MKKKYISIVKNVFITVITSILLLLFILNTSTLWTIRQIDRGSYVKSGFFCAIIGSGSMEPVISVNDLLFIKGSGTYQKEDIITYVSPQGSLITHRIKEISDTGYITQGDSNNVPDKEITQQRILGKVVMKLPGIGGIIYGVLTPAGGVLLIGIFLIIYLIQRIMGVQNESEKKESKNTKENLSEN